MKNILFALLFSFLILFSNLNAAYAWRADANIRVTNTRVTAIVGNGLPYPIYCEGYVYGATYFGVQLNSWFSATIPPGMTAYSYVYSNMNDPFVNGWANISCTGL